LVDQRSFVTGHTLSHGGGCVIKVWLRLTSCVNCRTGVAFYGKPILMMKVFSTVLSGVGKLASERWIVGLMAVAGVVLVAVGLIGRDLQQPQPVCYQHDLFVYCLQSSLVIVIVHETYWGLVVFGAFLLVVCGLWVFAGLKWPPRRR
jgi:hypothetical protein